MSRNMAAANRAVFAQLELFCNRRSEPIPSEGRRRYIRARSGTAEAKEDERYLQRGSIEARLRFGSERILAHIKVDKEHFVALIGFDYEPNVAPLVTETNTPGLTALVLAETAPRPRASPAMIRNIVEAGSMDDVDAADYEGHGADDIAMLFPPIRILKSPGPIDEDSVWRLFLMICADECANSGSWIEETLAGELESLTRLQVPSLPYASICESMFDADPRSMFMALYRCIEATYAYESSLRLVRDLGLEIPWIDMATSLSSQLGWRPQEASSLNLSLSRAVESDLLDLCDCLGATVGRDLQVSAGKALYSLRNQIVHYRPGTQRVAVESTDWNRLCRVLVRITFHVFSDAYA